jgi:hypothetical protein
MVDHTESWILKNRNDSDDIPICDFSPVPMNNKYSGECVHKPSPEICKLCLMGRLIFTLDRHFEEIEKNLDQIKYNSSA